MVAPRLLTFLLVWVLMVGSAAPARAQETKDPAARLAGQWTHKNEFLEMSLSFFPNGRYSVELKTGDEKVSERGKYRVSGAQLVLDPEEDETTTYSFKLDGAHLTLSGGPFSEPVTFRKKSGSPAADGEGAPGGSDGGSSENATWRKRIPVVPMASPPSTRRFAPVEVPTDPNPKRVFPKASVFQNPELYLQMSLPMTLVLQGGARRTVFNSWKWYFHPNGRVFVRVIRYRENGPAEGQVTTFWARYGVEPGEGAETLRVESDAGEDIVMKLVDGRRNLLWDKDRYGNLKWEQEALKKQNGE